MSDAHHCCFNSANGIFKGLGLALALLSAGCTSTGFSKLSLQNTSTPKSVGSIKKAEPASNEPVVAETVEKKDSISKLLEAVSTSNAYPGEKANPTNSAWCRYVDANARAQSAILRSPTIAADINDEGNGGVSVAFDFVDLARAKLKEKTAQAQCKRYVISNRLARTMLIAPQSLTLAGNRAKADYLHGQRSTLNLIKRKIKTHIARGEMTVQLGTALIQHAETVALAEFRAKAEADRRASIGKLDTGRMIGLDQELEAAERTLQEIDRRQRSIEAIKVSVSAGYGYQGDSGIQSSNGYGKIKLSYRIGALSPTRNEYEDIAAKARVDALHETNRGILWQSSEMSQAIMRAHDGLVTQRAQLLKALAEAKRNTALYVKGYEIEMLQPRYRAKIDEVAIVAELKGINATLIDMRRVGRNLQFK